VLEIIFYMNPKYHLNAEGGFVIENYNFAKPFANFFPGIAGKYGIPMWTFYVNRAQGICSFGTKDKDHAILEFFPANKAWQNVSSLGFRTFIKISSGHKPLFYEPFHNGFSNLGYRLANNMQISSSGLIIEETNFTLGLRVKVEYFNIPNASYAGLARIVSIKNLSRRLKNLQVIDGLPQVVAFGANNFFLKKLSRTIEAWIKVENLETGVPFYKLAVDPVDRPEVVHIKEGNFYLGLRQEKRRNVIIKPIIDPQRIFGPVTDFSLPYQFLEEKRFSAPAKESVTSKTPSAFLFLDLKLAPGAEEHFYALSGYMRSKEILNESLEKIIQPGYLEQKRIEAKEVIAKLEENIATSSSSKAFDLYTKQTYIDNIIRGGFPFTLPCGKIFYIYSRKHGDLERDYNKFSLQPTYLSQGNGNYRDVNQNRRLDAWFNPEIKDENIIDFINLLQADGFNPLVVKGASFMLADKEALKNKLSAHLNDKDLRALLEYLLKPFTPGEVILFIEESKIKLDISYDALLDILLDNSSKCLEAEHGEGFWSDHWAYNLDLLESYAGIYPEKLNELFFSKKVFSFFDNSETVRPRKEKYLLYNKAVRQLHAVGLDHAKKELIKKRDYHPHLVRTGYGKGEIYYTTLINKLLCLFANKMSSLDPFGSGVEMEANKPNWYDALNGLPALLGSSTCETFELKRLALMLKKILQDCRSQKLSVTEEVWNLISGLDGLIKDYFADSSPEKDFIFWDKSNSLKEGFRQKTKLGFSGKELDIPCAELAAILGNALNKLNAGLDKAKDKQKNLYAAYFINEAAEYDSLNEPYVSPKKFIQKKLPLFLEGQMHALRLAKDAKEATALYQATKNSGLFDSKLKMYKVTADLSSMPEEIGRCRVFAPGWLENESIWLHMEYKYLLEVLKQGLFAEFYSDFKNVLIPFQDPRVYGRSILENSSFIVSSAFADKKLHGNGFVARLSGSTCEFLQIWLLMNLGARPFFLNGSGELNLKFSPALAGWLFNRQGIYSFNFLSKIKVTYHNPKRKSTFGKNAAVAKKITFRDKNNNPVEISSDTIPAPYAEQVRSRQIKQIDIYCV